MFDSLVRSTDEDSAVDLRGSCRVVSDIFDPVDLKSSEGVVDGCDVGEPNSANVFHNDTVSSALVSQEVLVIRNDDWVG